MRIRPANAIDFYKTGHLRMYPKGTNRVYFNFTARSDKYGSWLPDFDHHVTHVGTQLMIKELFMELWQENFFLRPKDEVIEHYRRRMDTSLGPGAVSIDNMAALHDLGFMPLHIKALPEGVRVPIGVPMLTCRNTIEEFYWVPGYVETSLSSNLWKTITAATIAYEYRKMFERYAVLTGSPIEFVQWQGHDFSARGMSGVEDAARTGIGHLSYFTGTDTVSAIDAVEDYYGGWLKCGFIGGSVPASEHSVMCMDAPEMELGTFRRLINELYPSGVVSIVSDTRDFWWIMTEGLRQLKPEILARRPDAIGLAKVVFRPDSGDPVKIINGDPAAPSGTPEYKGALRCLYEVFGGPQTSTGHFQLNPRVGLIYGDSITLQRQSDILEGMHRNGFASSNVVLGIGSYTYQCVTRDTFGHAYKGTYGEVDGKPIEMFKKPATDDGTKHSAKGLLRVLEKDGEYVLEEGVSWSGQNTGCLKTLFLNGRMEDPTDWRQVRKNTGFKFF